MGMGREEGGKVGLSVRREDWKGRWSRIGGSNVSHWTLTRLKKERTTRRKGI